MSTPEPTPEVGAIIQALRAMPTRNDVDEWTVQRAADLLLEFGTRHHNYTPSRPTEGGFVVPRRKQ